MNGMNAIHVWTAATPRALGNLYRKYHSQFRKYHIKFCAMASFRGKIPSTDNTSSHREQFQLQASCDTSLNIGLFTLCASWRAALSLA